MPITVSEHDVDSASTASIPPNLAPTCGVTVLFPEQGRCASKTFERSGPASWRTLSSYNAGYLFSAMEYPLSDIDDVGELVKALAAGNALLVRGALSPAARRQTAQFGDAATFRRLTRPNGADEPSLVETPRRWVMVDVDGWHLPPGLNIRDQEDHGEIIDLLIRDLLHPCFHDARAIYQWSNSCGLTVGIAKVHIFFWLSEALTNREVSRRFKAHCPKITDRSPFSAAQPLYVANPVFATGYDPMPIRHGWHDGHEDEVNLPPVLFREPQHQLSAWGGSAPPPERAWLPPLLGEIGDGNGLGGFHTPIRQIIWVYVGHVLRGAIPRMDEQLINLISRRVQSAPTCGDRPTSDVAEYADQSALKRKIEQAICKRGSTENQT